MDGRWNLFQFCNVNIFIECTWTVQIGTKKRSVWSSEFSWTTYCCILKVNFGTHVLRNEFSAVSTDCRRAANNCYFWRRWLCSTRSWMLWYYIYVPISWGLCRWWIRINGYVQISVLALCSVSFCVFIYVFYFILFWEGGGWVGW